MIEIRLLRPARREFQADVYRPGVISLSRILWGSLGGGLLLFLIGVCSRLFQIGVLFPPLAATCFIGATCVYLRVARPKAVIVGHCVATIGGLVGCYLGTLMLGEARFVASIKLGLAVLLASAFMQVLDADHPPAAATAAIPAILPLPASGLVLPLHMAWGGVLAVVFAVAWNRVWFECPVPEEGGVKGWLRLPMGRLDSAGTVLCCTAALLMCFKVVNETVYEVGLGLMVLGLLVLGTSHFFAARYVRRQEAPESPSACASPGQGQTPQGRNK